MCIVCELTYLLILDNSRARKKQRQVTSTDSVLFHMPELWRLKLFALARQHGQHCPIAHSGYPVLSRQSRHGQLAKVKRLSAGEERKKTHESLLDSVSTMAIRKGMTGALVEYAASLRLAQFRRACGRMRLSLFSSVTHSRLWRSSKNFKI
jgi:hypothetical protein